MLCSALRDAGQLRRYEGDASIDALLGGWHLQTSCAGRLLARTAMRMAFGSLGRNAGSLITESHRLMYIPDVLSNIAAHRMPALTYTAVSLTMADCDLARDMLRSCEQRTIPWLFSHLETPVV